ncbi:g protein-coupled receptor [Anaeramoeba ignava]|uniref:G protein-coupled receptor n=1 Tax=Anaeramoeba ignava TaxID=1746090 RepID=A0A9Q0LND6_ANAIG|nr:g protein-coupled receptor [Anaeramoeba ignava]
MVYGPTIAALIGSSLGTVGSAIIIFVHFKFPEFRTFYRKLVFILSVYDLITAMIYLFPGRYNRFICKVQPIFISFFITTAAFWNGVISIITFLKVIKNTSKDNLDKFQKISHVVLWVISSTMAIIFIVFYDPEYHGATYWYFISILLYSVWWAYLLISLIFYITTVIKIRLIFREISQIRNHILQKKLRKNMKVQLRMTMIPIIYILIIFPTSFKRARQMADKNATNWPVLDIFQSFLISTQGFFDVILFVFFVKRVRIKLFGLFSCSKKNKSLHDTIPMTKEDVDYERFRNSSEKSLSNSDSNSEIDSEILDPKKSIN